MSIRSKIKQLEDRSPMEWLRERDIDLLICAELHAAGVLRDRFARLWPARTPRFSRAWVSVRDSDGESDLVVKFQDGETFLILLVENKIDAPFQDGQAERYAERANHWRQVDQVEEVITVLVCPDEYSSRPPSKLFDVILSYEDLIDSLRESGDERSAFLASALSDGIESCRLGYVPVPNEIVTGIWNAIWRIASAEQPALNMPEPGEKPGKATWIEFLKPHGFGGDGMKIVYKAERGQVDLQFNAMSPNTLQDMLAGLLEDDMKVEKAVNSSSLRVAVPCVDFCLDADDQHEAIREGLRQAERLRRFFVDNGKRIK